MSLDDDDICNSYSNLRFFFVANWMISQNKIDSFYTQLFAFIGLSITYEINLLKICFYSSISHVTLNYEQLNLFKTVISLF